MSTVFAAVTSAVGVTIGSVLPVVVLSLPSLFRVGVVIVALLKRLPVALAFTLPVIFITVVFPLGISGSVAVPVHGEDGPPSTLNCGFSICAGSVSVTAGVLAADGPLLATVMV